MVPRDMARSSCLLLHEPEPIPQLVQVGLKLDKKVFQRNKFTTLPFCGHILRQEDRLAQELGLLSRMT